jgi:hypothetical protein
MLSSPNLIIEGEHLHCEEKVWDLAMWLCNKLLPLDVGYEIVVTFRKFTKEQDGDAQGHHICFDKYNHEITIKNNLTFDEAMIAITHEFIHVQQYMMNYIIEKGNKTYWMGDEVSSKTHYFDQPWEIHARSLEKPIYKQYLGTLTQ